MILRREFLRSLALSGAACSLSSFLPVRGGAGSGPYEAEAERLTGALLRHFWNPHARIFQAPVFSADAVRSDPVHNNGYVFWPSLLALHALIEGERNHPGTYHPQIWTVYSTGLEQYWNPARNAYNAWLYFPGNDDSYYDDNAWAVVTLVEAHLATVKTDPAHAAAYLARAEKLMAQSVHAGWDNTGHPGGMKWGTDPTKAGTGDKATSATAAAALAALMLARVGIDPAVNTSWGKNALDWLMANLRNSDALVQDALVSPHWQVRPTLYTYNTGVPIRAFVEHYRLTHDPASLRQATQMARAAIDHAHRPLYDGLVRDPAVNYWYDYGYFVHYLVDGLLQLAQVTSDAELAGAITAEGHRQARYALRYLRDKDGFYWRNQRLYLIGSAQVQTWERLTGQKGSLTADANERSMEAGDSQIPVAQRPLVKTLLANAGAARLFWLVSRRVPVPSEEFG